MTAWVVSVRGMSESIIETHNLTKRFAKATTNSVTDLNFAVQQGEMVAFLGPNGAGKTTSIRMLTTLIAPSSGEAIVCGYNTRTQPHKVRAHIGYVGQNSSGSLPQRVRDELVSQGAFYGMSTAAARTRADDLITTLGLESCVRTTVQRLSGGQRRRLDIALGLMHSPQLIFLDEPSTGLDPQSRANLWKHITNLREHYGTTVFVTTHYLEEADQYAERIMVMDKGHIIADAPATMLKQRYAGDILTLDLMNLADVQRAVGVVKQVVPDSSSLTVDTATITLIAVHGCQALPQLLALFDAADIPVRRVTAVPPTLDDVFLALTGTSLRESGDHS